MSPWLWEQLRTRQDVMPAAIKTRRSKSRWVADLLVLRVLKLRGSRFIRLRLRYSSKLSSRSKEIKPRWAKM